MRSSNTILNGSGLLNRVGEVTLQCLKAPRPLAHHMAVWTIVGPHFMKVFLYFYFIYYYHCIKVLLESFQ